MDLPRHLARARGTTLPIAQPWPARTEHPASVPPTALFPGYRKLPDVAPSVLQKRADHCNDRRMASKRVQELSTSLFFAVMVKVKPPSWRSVPPSAPPRLLGTCSQGALEEARGLQQLGWALGRFHVPWPLLD